MERENVAEPGKAKCKWEELRMRISCLPVTTMMCSLILVLAAALAFASKPPSDVPVTTYVSDYNAAGAAYYVQSDDYSSAPTDGKGGIGYQNGVNNVISILVANGFNGISWGDWRLDLSSSTTRAVRLSFCNATTACPANAVQSGNPAYSAPANPPFWGTQYLPMHIENKCSEDNNDMYSMKPGQTFSCSALFRLPNISSTTFYRLDMCGNKCVYSEPETQKVQVACNSSGSDGNCNDWFIDPIPVVNADGSTSPGQTVARLNLVNSRPGWSYTNEGDFYLTFHIHVTRP